MFNIVYAETNGAVTSVAHMERLASDLWFNLNMERSFSTPSMSAKDFVAVLRMYPRAR
jgi:hypothetical protein